MSSDKPAKAAQIQTHKMSRDQAKTEIIREQKDELERVKQQLERVSDYCQKQVDSSPDEALLWAQCKSIASHDDPFRTEHLIRKVAAAEGKAL